MIIRNFYIEKILPFINKPVIKIITGMRRVGKSTILKLLINELINKGIKECNIIYINKESLEFDFIKNYNDLNNYIIKKLNKNSSQNYIFIDEIQEITDWEKAICSFLADHLGDIYITGSNAHLLSSELATLLTGRYVELSIYPLTFDEFLLFRKDKTEQTNLEAEFKLFLKYGGLPGVHFLDLKDEIIYQYLNSLFNSILLKDVILKNNIRDVNQLENITRFIFDNCGNITTSKKISDFLKNQKLKISVETVQNYLKYLIDAFFIYKVDRYDIKGKKTLEMYEKYYMGDIGLRHGFLGYNIKDISGILENIIYLELIKRGYKVKIGKNNFEEIDFIAQKNNEIKYFQVCYLLASNETIDREFGVFKNIDDNYPKFVLSLDELWENDYKGIKRINIIDFLINETT